MTYTYLDLDHGPGTHISDQDVFNHRFSELIACNFTYLNDAIDDYDLFYLISEETASNQNHKKDYIRFVLPPKAFDHIDLFETLHFDIQLNSIYTSTSNKNKTVPESPYLIEPVLPTDQGKWLDFILNQYDDLSENELKQTKDYYNEYFKQKKYEIYAIKQDQEIMASMIIARSKTNNEIVEIITSNNEVYLYLFDFMNHQELPTVLSIDEDDINIAILDQLAFKKVERYAICSKDI